ncbi:conserved hypothetical protein [Candidatus Zixiibacteriota bacterium]|nr:conserved hypothetical protein [candidate division Zixibacteria bacterium]
MVLIRFRVIIISLIILAGTGLALWYGLTRSHITSAERGRRLAEKEGCFACHGPEGSGGVANFGRTDGTVPNFRDDVMMFAHGPDNIREWIAEGKTEAKAKSQTWQEERKKGVLKMPAFGNRLSNSEIDDLVSFVMISSGHPRPDDSLALKGLQLTKTFGCVGCHGPGGAFARPNPKSFKGYLAPWIGPDFKDLVRNRAEFDQWVENGVSDRLKTNLLARYFLNRAVLHMPEYRSHLQPGDLDALWAYITWRRAQEPQ